MMKEQAKKLAARGRFGDTMLVHMNEAEVAGLASLAPEGKLTINPDTGMPEAFLPFLLPLLGGIGGLLGATAPVIGATTAAAPIAGAAGTGLAGAGLGLGALGVGAADALATGLSAGIPAATQAAAPVVAGATAPALQAAAPAITAAIPEIAATTPEIMAAAGGPTVEAANALAATMGPLAGGPEMATAAVPEALSATLPESLQGMTAGQIPQAWNVAGSLGNEAVITGYSDPAVVQGLTGNELIAGPAKVPTPDNLITPSYSGFKGNLPVGGEPILDPLRPVTIDSPTVTKSTTPPARKPIPRPGPGQGTSPATDPRVPARNPKPRPETPAGEGGIGGLMGGSWQDMLLPLAMMGMMNPGGDEGGGQKKQKNEVGYKKYSGGGEKGSEDLLANTDPDYDFSASGYGVTTPEYNYFDEYYGPDVISDTYSRIYPYPVNNGGLIGYNDGGIVGLAGGGLTIAQSQAARGMANTLENAVRIANMPKLRYSPARRAKDQAWASQFGRGGSGRRRGMDIGPSEGLPDQIAARNLAAMSAIPAHAYGNRDTTRSNLEAAMNARPTNFTSGVLPFSDFGAGMNKPIGMARGGLADLAMQEQMPMEAPMAGGIADMMEPTGMPEVGSEQFNQDKDLFMMAIAAVQGQMPREQAEQVLMMFVEAFGEGALMDLVERIQGSQQQAMPQQATPAAYPAPPGSTPGRGDGVSDSIPAMIGDQQQAALSPGEYVVPSDVVSGMGNGDTMAGAQQLDNMVDRTRMAKTGVPQQPNPLNPYEVMPV